MSARHRGQAGLLETEIGVREIMEQKTDGGDAICF